MIIAQENLTADAINKKTKKKKKKKKILIKIIIVKSHLELTIALKAHLEAAMA